MKGIQNKFNLILASALIILITACEEFPPKASFTIDGSALAIGDTIQFQSTSTYASTFSWEFGDGGSSSEENPTHIYTTPGTYTVRLMVSGSDGSDATSKTLKISPRLLWKMKVLYDHAKTAVTIDAADLDADGDPDLVASSAKANTLIFFENDYPNWNTSSIDLNAMTVTFFECGDVDGNGTMDVIANLLGTTQLVWYEKQNLSWQKHTIDSDTPNSDFMVLADINKDNKIDVATAGSYSAGGEFVWYENQFPDWIKHTIGDFGKYPCVKIIDIDGDGLLDAVASMNIEGTIVWFKNEGNGIAWVKNTIAVDIDKAWILNTGDVNGDGAPDLLVGHYLGLYWYENQYPDFIQHTIDTDVNGWMVVNDVNKDGINDIIAVNATNTENTIDSGGDFSGSIVWYENQQSGWKKHIIGLNLDQPRLFAVVDVDGDSYDDIVATSVDRIILYMHPGQNVTSD